MKCYFCNTNTNVKEKRIYVRECYTVSIDKISLSFLPICKKHYMKGVYYDWGGELIKPSRRNYIMNRYILVNIFK